MVSGPMYSKPIFTKTNEDAQIAVVKTLSPMAIILCVSLDDFATISKVTVIEDNNLTIWLTGGADCVSPVRIGALLVRSRNGINEPCQVRIQTS